MIYIYTYTLSQSSVHVVTQLDSISREPVASVCSVVSVGIVGRMCLLSSTSVALVVRRCPSSFLPRRFFQESLSPPMPMNSLSLPCVFERACDRLPCFGLAASRSWFGAFEGEPVASYFPNRLSYLSSGMLTQSSCMAYSVPGGLFRK